MICAPFLGTEGRIERVLMVVGMRCLTREAAREFCSKGRYKMSLDRSFLHRISGNICRPTKLWTMCSSSFHGLFLILALLSIPALHSQAGVVTITVNGTVSSITDAPGGLGYTVGQSVSFYWVLNNYAPQTPSGLTSSVEHEWKQENAVSEPKLFSEVGGTGIGGTYQEGPGGVPFDRLRVRPLGTFNYAPIQFEMRTDDFNTTTNNRGIFLNANNSYLVREVRLETSIFNSPWPQSAFTDGGVLPDPTAFFLQYLGTYNARNDSNTTAEIFVGNGTNSHRIKFTPSTVVISSDCPPVPEPTSMAIFGLGALGFAYRARRKSKAQA